LRISIQGWLFEASKEFPAIPMNQGIRDFCLRLAIDSDMQRFESCRPSQPVRLSRVLKQTALKMCDMADTSVDASGARGRSAAISPRICEQSMM
jgi:hypothetical protein